MMNGSSSCFCASSSSSSSSSYASFFIISSSSSKLKLHHPNMWRFNSSSSSSSSSSIRRRKCEILLTPRSSTLHPSSSSRSSSILCTSSSSSSALPVITESNETLSSSSSWTPKIDKSGRFCSPRAARELALLMAYASCLEGSDPVRLLDKRINAPRDPGYEFDKNSLLEYNPMSFGGPPITTDTVEEADHLTFIDEKESAIEAEVLSAPPKLVYSKLILRFTRKLLVAVVDKWDDHVIVIDKIVPSTWKDEPAGKILELCILHLAMSEITVLGTRHQIVINEAVDLAKRFCDGAAPRIINGCLRTFVKTVEAKATGVARSLEAKQMVSS